MRFEGSTVDKDLGAAALLREIKLADNATVECGLFDGDVHPDEEMTLPQIGAINEFGSEDKKHPPPRPFMRRACDEQGTRWRGLLEKAYASIIDGKGKVKVIDALQVFGEHAASDIRKTIDSVTSPAKAESTIKQEGGSLRRTKTGRVKKGAREFQRRFTHPLIWFGYLRSAIRECVVVGSTKRFKRQPKPSGGR